MERPGTLQRLMVVVTFALGMAATSQGRAIYVDAAATGTYDGLSWTDAFASLQDALTVVLAGDEIRVAHGVYRPDQGASVTLGDRKATFRLLDGVTIKGGFPGLGAVDPNASDIALYETILSGDLSGNDANAASLREMLFESYGENSYHVVTGSGVNETAVLDGCTVAGGNANGVYLDDAYPYAGLMQAGAGLCNLSGHPTLIHCTFTGNSAWFEGGGMFNYDSSPTLCHCAFRENYAYVYGGGMSNCNGHPTLTHCTFEKNSSLLYVQFRALGVLALSESRCDPTPPEFGALARIGPHLGGGGMHNYLSNPMITDCIFSRNSAGLGGGMTNDSSCPVLTDCILDENRSGYGGGAMSNSGSSPTLVLCMFTGNSTNSTGGGMENSGQSCPILMSCTFSGNHAFSGGGGIYGHQSNAMLTDCIFAGNSCDRAGGGVYDFGGAPVLSSCRFHGNRANAGGAMRSAGGSPRLSGCTLTDNWALEGGGLFGDSFTLTNSIVWGNAPNQIDARADVTFCDVEGGWEGQGNIHADPLFAAPGYWDPNGTPEDPNDDFRVEGDYHLKSQGGRWDPVGNDWVVDEVTSPCIDAGDPTDPIGLEPLPNGGRLNMGAYGGTAEASMSYSGEAIVEDR